MKLFGSYTSPFVRHCRIAVLETRAECEFVESDSTVSAVRSPTKRLPFLEDGELLLTDSASIIRYLRERAGQPFLPDVRALDRFCLVDTALGAAVNLFVLERDGITPEQSPYLKRERARIDTCLRTLEADAPFVDGAFPVPASAPTDDVVLRLACFLAWTQFRRRLSLDSYPKLSALLARAQKYEPFAVTAPHD